MSSVLPPAPEFGTALPQEASPEVLRFLSLRRSTSAVTLREPAPNASELQDLLRLATRAPDHGKLSPWRFIVLRGEAKAAFADRLEALALSRDDKACAAKVGKFRIPPLAVVVVFSPKEGPIPQWEQQLSAGAVCMLLLESALALGYGANWTTDWYSYDADALEILGLGTGERVAGFVSIGTPAEPPLERDRPTVDGLVSTWKP